MTFKQSITEQLNNLDLRPRRYTKNKNHLFGDFYELVSLFNNDGISRNDFIQRYKKENIEIHKLSKGEDEIGSVSHEEDDKAELWAEEILIVCSERSSLLGDKYPFQIDNTTMKLKVHQNESMKLYISLLLASSLNYFPDFASFLTSDFEMISFHALKSFLPENAIVKQLGKNTDIEGTAQQKIKTLAQLMNVRMDEDEINRNVQGNQERGLDVVGWIPFNDKVPNFVSVLGQCACGKDWFKKQGETRRYENAYFRFYKSVPLHTMFIPYALVESSTSFYQSDEVDCLLFERHRILECLEDLNLIDDLTTKAIVNECITFQENIT